MGFWNAATTEAGRQFGGRYWRWFVFSRVARRTGAPILFAILAAAVAIAGYVAYRLLSPDWSLVASTVSGWAPEVGRWAIVVVVAAAVAAGLAWAVVWLWRAHSWRWSRF